MLTICVLELAERFLKIGSSFTVFATYFEFPSSTIIINALFPIKWHDWKAIEYHQKAVNILHVKVCRYRSAMSTCTAMSGTNVGTLYTLITVQCSVVV